MSKDQKKLKGVRQLNARKETVIYPYKPIEQSTDVHSLLPVSSLTSPQKITAVTAVSELKDSETSPHIIPTEPTQNLHSLFSDIIHADHEKLMHISRQVKSGVLSEKEAEDQLLLLALTNCFSLPISLAKNMLPKLRQSLEETPKLLQGLKQLWEDEGQ